MTTNPVMIMVVNMTIVFAVLFLLGIIIELIHKADPTKKSAKEQEAEELTTYVAAAPIAAPQRLTPEEAEVVDYETVMDKESTIRQ